MSSQVRLTTKIHRKHPGQALVEFALVLPVLLLLLMGVMDFGWMVFNYAQLFNATREGLRYGTVPGTGGTPQYYDCAGIKGTITGLAGISGIQSSNITIKYDTGVPQSMGIPNTLVGTCDSSFSAISPRQDGQTAGVHNGDRITIHLSVQVRFLTPFLRAMFPNGLGMTFDAARSIFPDGFSTYSGP